MEFQIGEEVEVKMIEEGLQGSYYAAKVIYKKASHQYKVAYKNLLKDDNSGPLEEDVDANLLRPVPPQVLKNCYSLYELADVYEDEGWWAGIIWGKFASDYFVYFPTLGEEMPYPLEKLRVHQEWLDGEWTCPQRFRLDIPMPEEKIKIEKEEEEDAEEEEDEEEEEEKDGKEEEEEKDDDDDDEDDDDDYNI